MNDSLPWSCLTNLFDTPLTKEIENLIIAEPDLNEELSWPEAEETEPILTNGKNTSFSAEDLSSTQTMVTSPLNERRNFQENQEMLPPVQTVDFVDLERYDGLWYEVAKTRNLFAFGCNCTTATYELLSDTSISVFNACNRFLARGPRTTIEGVAEVVEPETNAKLEVNFEGVPFPGDYWIIDLVEENPQSDYSYAVVSDPNRSNVFILSRTPNADPDILAELYAGLEAQFYDTDEIVRSPQPLGCECP
ncbi:lipocalin family protein [Myxosarcina sp. GI1(2024)]